MNILIVTNECGTKEGGLALSCFNLVNLLSKEHSVQVTYSTICSSLTVESKKLRVTPFLRKEYKLKNDCNIYKDIDLIIGFGGNFNGYYAYLLAYCLRKKFILCLRGSDINLVKWSVEDAYYLKAASRYACKIVCLSKEMIANLLCINPYIEEKVVIIPNVMSGNSEAIEFPNLPNKVKLGVAASFINDKKGITSVLHMLAKFKEINLIPVSLELVGNIDQDILSQYKKIIEILNLNNIVFKKYMLRSELRKIMRDWDFYIQGSICEGDPNIIRESLLSGTAFISTKTGFIAELLMKDYPMFFFKSLDPQIMAENLKELIEFKDKATLYLNAQKKLNEYCNESCIYDKWMNLLSTYGESKKKILDITHVTAVILHDIKGDVHDSITTPVMIFRNFVKFIYEQGFGLCSMKDYLEKTVEDKKKWIVCTFDDGYESLADIAAPILSEYKFTATVFICTGLIGKTNEWNNKDTILRKHLTIEKIKKLIDYDWEIASHGVTHRNLLKLSDSDIEYELKESKIFLQQLVGYSNSYSYPYGCYNDYIKKCVAKHYRYAFSVTQGGTNLKTDDLQVRRYFISEIYKML